MELPFSYEQLCSLYCGGFRLIPLEDDESWDIGDDKTTVRYLGKELPFSLKLDESRLILEISRLEGCEDDKDPRYAQVRDLLKENTVPVIVTEPLKAPVIEELKQPVPERKTEPVAAEKPQEAPQKNARDKKPMIITLVVMVLFVAFIGFFCVKTDL